MRSLCIGGPIRTVVCLLAGLALAALVSVSSTLADSGDSLAQEPAEPAVQPLKAVSPTVQVAKTQKAPKRKRTRIGRVARTATAVPGRAAVVRGVLKPKTAGRRLTLQVRSPRGWVTVDTTKSRRGGAFALRWRLRRYTVRTARVRFSGDAAGYPSQRRLRIASYKSANVSYYGPGFWGSGTACGGRLAPKTLGVAHKTLPCGTRVTFHHAGRTVTAPVIDRGPYVAGREFDLTEALKNRLGVGSTGTVRYAVGG